MSLRLDWCSYAAAKYAVEHWHYSKRMPRSKLVTIGAWENNKYIGAVIFSYGATPEIGKQFSLSQVEIVELTRVALSNHGAATSRIISIAINMFHKNQKKIRLLVSFADTNQGHLGVIYQASNWVYVGCKKYHEYIVLGKREHPRTLGSRYGIGGQSIPWLRNNIDPRAERVVTAEKHKYLYPLDPEMRERISPLAKPYPKKCGRSSEVDGDQSSTAG